MKRLRRHERTTGSSSSAGHLEKLCRFTLSVLQGWQIDCRLSGPHPRAKITSCRSVAEGAPNVGLLTDPVLPEQILPVQLPADIGKVVLSHYRQMISKIMALTQKRGKYLTSVDDHVEVVRGRLPESRREIGERHSQGLTRVVLTLRCWIDE